MTRKSSPNIFIDGNAPRNTVTTKIPNITIINSAPPSALKYVTPSNMFSNFKLLRFRGPPGSSRPGPPPAPPIGGTTASTGPNGVSDMHSLSKIRAPTEELRQGPT